MEQSESSVSRWLLLSVLTHGLWGMYPVIGRYLQTRPAVPLDPINLLLVCQGVCLALNTAASSAAARRVASKAAAEDEGGDEGGDDGDREGDGEGDDDASLVWTRRERQLVGGVCVAFSLRAMTNMASTGLTLAYNISLIQMLAPFVMSCAAHLFLGEQLPGFLFVSLLISTAGSATVFVGQSALVEETSELTARDFAGLGLQFFSIFCSAAQRTLMKLTQGFLTPLQFMRIQYSAVCVSCLLWSAVQQELNPANANWSAWLQLTAFDWIMFATLAGGILFGAATLQVRVVRGLGLAKHSAMQPVRLLTTVLGSAVLLGERVEGVLEVVGLLVVLAAQIAFARSTARERTNKKPTYELVAVEEHDESVAI